MLEEVWEAYNHIEVCAGLIINLKCCISTFVCNDDVMACVVIEVKHLSSDKHTNTTEDANTKKHTYKYANTGTPIQTYNYEHKYNSTNTNHTSFIASKLPPNKYRNTNTQIQMKISAEIEIFAMMTWSAAAVS